MNLFPHLDHDGALLPVELEVDLPHAVLVHLRRDDLEAVDNPREAIIQGSTCFEGALFFDLAIARVKSMDRTAASIVCLDGNAFCLDV